MLSLIATLQTLGFAAKDRLRDEKGATAVEYGIMVALIAVAIIIAVTAPWWPAQSPSSESVHGGRRELRRARVAPGSRTQDTTDGAVKVVCLHRTSGRATA